MNEKQTKEEWEEKFDKTLPLSFFATEDYHGGVDDNELQFVQWQDRQTWIANERRQKVYDLIKYVEHQTEQRVANEIADNMISSFRGVSDSSLEKITKELAQIIKLQYKIND